MEIRVASLKRPNTPEANQCAKLTQYEIGRWLVRFGLEHGTIRPRGHTSPHIGGYNNGEK